MEAFLDDMPRRFEAADLVLARSGASTVAELAAAGKPAVLIPLPTAADDHQRKNADVMAQAGAARILPESDLTPDQLEGTLAICWPRLKICGGWPRPHGRWHIPTPPNALPGWPWHWLAAISENRLFRPGCYSTRKHEGPLRGAGLVVLGSGNYRCPPPPWKPPPPPP